MPQTGLTGRWELNAPASKLPFVPPRSVVLDIVVDGDDISLTERSVDGRGVAETVTIRARTDNRTYPVSGSALADGFAIEQVDGRTWRARGTRRGETVFTETIELAADGASFREEAETTLADGTRAPATLIYERVETAG